ncbi:hypothetical protein L7F22_045077 [Adiantum nelumboides]|nr:hypothetical protein [Adiantum nelumboides]
MSLKGDSPEEVWSGKPASYDHLRIFGCEAFVHIRPELRSKLDAKSIKGLFMGYGEEGEMGYRIWLPQLKKVVRSRDVVFNEARLLQNNCASKHDHKKVKFQHDQPPIRPIFDLQDAPHMAENDDEPVVFEPDDIGQQIEAPEGHLQPQNNAGNGAENDVQQPVVDDFIMPPDVDPLPDETVYVSQDFFVRRNIPFADRNIRRPVAGGQMVNRRWSAGCRRVDGYREEGSSSQDRHPIPILHEVGKGSSQAEEAFRMQFVNDMTMFKHLIENPRLMEFLQSPLMAQQAQKHPPLSGHIEAQFQVPTVSQKGKEHSHARESCEAPKENLSVHEQTRLTLSTPQPRKSGHAFWKRRRAVRSLRCEATLAVEPRIGTGNEAAKAASEAVARARAAEADAAAAVALARAAAQAAKDAAALISANGLQNTAEDYSSELRLQLERLRLRLMENNIFDTGEEQSTELHPMEDRDSSRLDTRNVMLLPEVGFPHGGSLLNEKNGKPDVGLAEPIAAKSQKRSERLAKRTRANTKASKAVAAASTTVTTTLTRQSRSKKSAAQSLSTDPIITFLNTNGSRRTKLLTAEEEVELSHKIQICVFLIPSDLRFQQQRPSGLRFSAKAVPSDLRFSHTQICVFQPEQPHQICIFLIASDLRFSARVVPSDLRFQQQEQP